MEYLYETHMHTSEVSGCAVSTAAEQVCAYKKMGYTGIIVTDHFLNGNSTCPFRLPWEEKMGRIVAGYSKAKEEGDKVGLDVYLGWEFTIKGSDLLTYGLDIGFLLSNPNLDKLNIEDYSRLIRENGGYLAQAHPYRDSWYIEHKFPVDHHLIDGIEAYNAMDTDKANRLALEFAEFHNLPMQAGSDSHNAGIKRYSGIKLRKKANDIFDIIKAIKANEVELLTSGAHG